MGALGGMGVLPLGRVSLSLKSPRPQRRGSSQRDEVTGAGWQGGGVPEIRASSQVCTPCVGLWRHGPPALSTPVPGGTRPGPVGRHHGDHQAGHTLWVRHLLPTSLPGETLPCGPTPRTHEEIENAVPGGGRTQADLVHKGPPLSLPFST